MTYEVFDHAAELWAIGQRTGVTVDDADLVIAATAQIEGLEIASANPKHFAWIEGLRVSNWRDP